MPVRLPSFVDDLPLAREALLFAAARHGDQRREADHAAFILHPLEVAHLLRGRGEPDHVVAAGVLHDVIEDAHVEADELRRRFGHEVADLVLAVSEPKEDGAYAERKAELRAKVARAPEHALVIYAADKVAKVRELRLRMVRGEEDLTEHAERLAHYWASLGMLEERLGAHPLVRQLRFELEALELWPPAR